MYRRLTINLRLRGRSRRDNGKKRKGWTGRKRGERRWKKVNGRTKKCKFSWLRHVLVKGKAKQPSGIFLFDCVGYVWFQVDTILR